MATNPTKIMLADGQEIDATAGTCEGCGEPLASHKCGSPRTAGAGVKHRAVSEHPICVHCGGRIHFNMSGSAINAECLVRQYALDTGLMTDPNERLPVLTLEMMGEIASWGKGLAVAPSYGKMESAAGGAGTYSGLRVKTGRKKKAVAAPDGSKIEDIAESVSVDAPKKGKGKSTGKNKGKGKAKRNKNNAIAEPAILDPTDEGFGPIEDDDTTEVAETPATVEPEGLEEITDDDETAAVIEAEQIVEARPARTQRKRTRTTATTPMPATSEPETEEEPEPFGAEDLSPVVSGTIIPPVGDDGLSERDRRRQAREERRRQLSTTV